MERYSHYWLAAAFIGGVLVTLGFKDLYPDLQRRYHRAKHGYSSLSTPSSSSSTSHDLHVTLEDHALPAPPPTIPTGIESAIGNTPLFLIRSLSAATNCSILAKAEHLNGAGGTPKDRVALSILRAAEAAHLLSPHSADVVYEGTVGSTGIALAALARARGYTAHICMPDDVAPEKASLLAKLGAVVERVPPAPIVDPAHYVNRARALAAEQTADPDIEGRGFFADQFENEANYLAHLHGTGPEIARQTGGRVDAFVAGAGTGGTISGVAMCLKALWKEGKVETKLKDGPKIVLADPQGSGLYNKVKYGVLFNEKEREGTRRRQQVDSMVEGIGVNRITKNFEVGRALIDDAIRVTDEQAMRMARWLVEKDGIFVGSSSAVNCFAATKLAYELGPGHTIVTILCDSGARHLSRFWAAAGDIGNKTDTTIDQVLAP